MKIQKKQGAIFTFIVFFISISFAFGKVFAEEKNVHTLKYPVYLNGTRISISDALFIGGKTYIPLREFCEKIGIDIKWVDPAHHQLPIPGGNLPSGVNLGNPTFVYTKEVVDFTDTNKTMMGVDITEIYKKYQNPTLKYYFSDTSFIINTDKKIILPLNYNPSNERMYVGVNEFKEKIQPYLLDLCMQ